MTASAAVSRETSGPLSTRSEMARTVHVRNNIVFAGCTLDVSSTFDGNQLKSQDDSYYYMLIAGTNGVLDQIRWNVGEHVPRGHDQGRWDMKWFVD